MSDTLLTTPLDHWHRQHGARMVPFAGYAMPVQYDLKGDLATRCKGGVMAEHLHCRAQAALFDVSHMGQAMLQRRGRAGTPRVRRYHRSAARAATLHAADQ